ncbi:MAG: hypothetical protein J6T67_04445 [Paludibacteraceae bacterium]|nr:hypothetical protein [Paludibacteraceae bacterium]MBR4714163.1 hypothetical protein [Paludibacteraceae bacterium]
MEKELEPITRKSATDITREIDRLLADMKQKFNILQFEQKQIQPFVNDIANVGPQGSDSPEAMVVTKDLVCRLTQADKTLKEAFYMIQDAISTIATGCKNYKESNSLQKKVG